MAQHEIGKGRKSFEVKLHVINGRFESLGIMEFVNGEWTLTTRSDDDKRLYDHVMDGYFEANPERQGVITTPQAAHIKYCLRQAFGRL